MALQYNLAVVIYSVCVATHAPFLSPLHCGIITLPLSVIVAKVVETS